METKYIGLLKYDKISIKESNCAFSDSPKGKLDKAMEVLSTEALSKGTEGHHASHVLTFFSYMAYNVVKGKGVRQHLLERVIHHLKALQEFIEDPELNVLVKSMIKSIHIQYEKFPKEVEQSAETISLWLVCNQASILRLAECYRKQSVFDGLLPMKIPVRLANVAGTAIQGLRDRNLATGERLLGQLFKGYFNNKMTVLIFLIQVKQHKPEARGINGVCCFLDDLYRHMLADSNQKRYRRVFIWLKKFVQKLPNVKTSQRGRALDFVRDLYGVFGINLQSAITGDLT
jgi:hypothetical protein